MNINWIKKYRSRFFVITTVFLTIFLLSGCSSPREKVYNEGYEEGLGDGYDDGHADGIADGYDDGVADGYDEGYTNCQQKIRRQY